MFKVNNEDKNFEMSFINKLLMIEKSALKYT